MTQTQAIDTPTQKRIDAWLNGPYDEQTKKTIKLLVEENPQEAIDSFYTTLSFGTGGLRGLMGVGSNRINRYTVGSATQGLANYLKKVLPKDQTPSVFIGYDSRINSRLFAEEAAKVLAGNDIHVHLCQDIRPTPFISFGCRYKKCSAAIMLTASHNPPEYNGYKVYWSDGGQILPPHDQGIIHEVNAISDYSMVKSASSLTDKLIHPVDPSVDEAYLSEITKLQFYPTKNQSEGAKLHILYTSLHGVGISLMPEALKRWGFPNVSYVEAQCKPDGNFPTVHSPNPEEKAALTLGIEQLKKTKADILIANDPDADRVGVVVNHLGEMVILNGNQIACICLQHICEALTAQQRLSAKAAFVKTIVTTELFKVIATAYDRACFSVLTGFKYIAQKINEWELDPKNGYDYLFGGEESYGYLLGTVARDKDAISASALIAEVALCAKLQGKTLVDLLYDLYRTHGIYYEKLMSVKFEESKIGREQMARGMKRIETNPPKALSGVEVRSLDNYFLSLSTELKSGKPTPITLPKSEVLCFNLVDGSKITIRPSGTEPKIKIYCEVIKKSFSTIPNGLMEAEKHADSLLKALSEELQK